VRDGTLKAFREGAKKRRHVMISSKQLNLGDYNRRLSRVKVQPPFFRNNRFLRTSQVELWDTDRPAETGTGPVPVSAGAVPVSIREWKGITGLGSPSEGQSSGGMRMSWSSRTST